MFEIIKAKPETTTTLSSLALRSKAHWGYSKGFIEQVTEELNYSASDVITNPTYLAQIKGETIGFYQLVELGPKTVELEALFVEPVQLGLGIGQKLFKHAVVQAQRAGYQSMHIQSDPYAAGFYSKQGCLKVGEKASLSIPGRLLPLMSYDLV